MSCAPPTGLPTSAREPLAGAPVAAGAAVPATPRHLLVWVGNHPHATPLVRHAALLARSQAMSWTVMRVDTPGFPLDGRTSSAHAIEALKLAQTLGASTADIQASSVVAAVVERARAENASMVLIGGHAAQGWLDRLPRAWLGHLADALSARLPSVAVDVVYFPDPGVPAATRRTARPRRRIDSSGWLKAAATVALCTVISETLLPYLELAGVATVYWAGVVYVALRHGQSAAMLAVVMSILLFDLLVVDPRWSFKPTEPQYYVTFIVMAIVGLVISRLADHARQQTRVAEARARRGQALNELASHLVSAQSEHDIAAGLTGAVQATFGAASALLVPDAGGRLQDPHGFCPADGLALAQQCFDHPVRATATPASSSRDLLCLPLHGATGPVGVLAVSLQGNRLDAPEERDLLTAFTNQAALAMQRSLFERRSAAAALDAETERLRNTLLSGISHDFRTPLTTIVGSATSLLEQSDALDAPGRTGLVRDIIDEAQRMHRSMSDLLDLTRLEEGAVQLRHEWCPADELVEEAHAVLRPRLQGRALHIDVPPDAIVWCDPRLVQQVLVNLVDNAVHYTPAHSAIDVRVAVDGTRWRLVVADDGPGLPADLLQDAFKKFARVRGEPATAGTGLGLAICAAVARLHGGTIEAVNDGGARFTLTLPQPPAPVTGMEDPA